MPGTLPHHAQQRKRYICADKSKNDYTFIFSAYLHVTEQSNILMISAEKGKNNYDGGNDLFIFGFLSAPITKSDYIASTDRR